MPNGMPLVAYRRMHDDVTDPNAYSGSAMSRLTRDGLKYNEVRLVSMNSLLLFVLDCASSFIFVLCAVLAHTLLLPVFLNTLFTIFTTTIRVQKLTDKSLSQPTSRHRW